MQRALGEIELLGEIEGILFPGGFLARIIGHALQGEVGVHSRGDIFHLALGLAGVSPHCEILDALHDGLGNAGRRRDVNHGGRLLLRYHHSASRKGDTRGKNHQKGESFHGSAGDPAAKPGETQSSKFFVSGGFLRGMAAWALHRTGRSMNRPVATLLLSLTGLLMPAVGIAQDAEEVPQTAERKVALAADAQLSGWLVSSRKLLEEAAALDPDTPNLRFYRAIQELREGNTVKAAAFARASLVTGEKISDCRTLLGLLAMRGKDYPQAEQQMRDAVEADPENSRGYYNLSEVLRWRGRPREALAQLEIAQKKQPDDPVLALKIRLTHIEIGERLTFVRPKSAGSETAVSDPAWTLTEAALALRGGKFDRAAVLLDEARNGLQPEFFYPLLQEDHFFQTYKSEPTLEKFFN